MKLAVVVLLSVVISLSGLGCMPGGGAAVNAADEIQPKAIPVTVTPATKRTFAERVTAQGNVGAKNLAMIAPRLDGTITEFFVDEGDAVVANETRLFQTDKVKVERAVAADEQNLAMTRAGRREAAAQLAGVKAQYDKAKIDFDRYTRLREQNAIAADAVERADAALKVAEAGLDRANAGVAVSVEQEKRAESALAVSQKNLSDSLLISPMDGVVTKRLSEPGEFVGAGKPVLRIVDPSLLEVSAFLPGETYPKVITGDTRVQVAVNGMEIGRFPITYKSAEIQPMLRTFEIKCLIENPPAGMAPGAMAEIAASLVEREGLGVPAAAIVSRGGKNIVFVVENGTAKQVEVRKGLDTDGWTELVEPALAEGAAVITEGQSLVNDGAPVAVQQESK